MSDDIFVVVTLAGNGVQHVYGPWPTRQLARAHGARFLRTAQTEGYGLNVSVHKVLWVP